jgi:3-dehydroquinate synthase
MSAGDQLTIRSRLGDYTVDFRDDVGWVDELSELTNAFFIVDDRVWQLHGSGSLEPLASRSIHLLSATEETKTLDGFATLCEAMIAMGVKRSSVVVSIGGGVVQDVTGFLTSVLYRGIRWVYVPSTLLGQADSCIGAKTSINFGPYKNLLGTMYPPQRVIAHPPLVATLDVHQFFSGLGEIVKMHIAGGPGERAWIESKMEALCIREPAAVSEAVQGSLRIKQRFIEKAAELRALLRSRDRVRVRLLRSARSGCRSRDGPGRSRLQRARTARPDAAGRTRRSFVHPDIDVGR